MSSELSQVIVKMNGEINQIMERNLSPHFETIRVIESLLKQLPEFKRLEQENADLKKRLSLCMELSNLEINNKTDLELSNQEVQNDMQSYVPVSVQPVVKNEIKLEIVETPSSIHPIVSEDELYKTVNLSNHIDNKLQTVAEEDEEEEELECEEDEVETSEEEVEAVEADEEEEEVEEEASEAEASEAEASEADEEASEADEDEEESGGEGENPPEEEAEEGGVGENPPEEEVFIITIKGKGNFYTSNETNGDIYAIEGEDDVGDIVGKFVNKIATFTI